MRISEKRETEYSLWARLIFWAQKIKYGQALLPSKIWGRSPSLLYGVQALYRAIDRKGSPLDPALRTLLSLRVSHINNCSFCTDIGEAVLKKRGVSMEKVQALTDFESNAAFTESERAALAYTEAVTLSDRRVNDEVFGRLSRYFSPDEIVEMTAVIGYQNMASKFNAALDVPAQGFCLVAQKKAAGREAAT